MVAIEACVRLVPGSWGQTASLAEESFEDGLLLEHPQYTRPRGFEGLEIPEVLLSGDHKKIAAWRKSMREVTTREKRPDLWARFGLRQSTAKGRLSPTERTTTMDILQTLEHEEAQKQLAKRAIPEVRPGDTLRVNVRIKEGERERVQAFEGVCIARAGAGVRGELHRA